MGSPMYGAKIQSHATRRFIALSAVMLVVAVLSQQAWAAGPRGAAKSALAPLEQAMAAAANRVADATSIFGDVSSLRAENARLRAADEALRAQVVQLDAAEKENAALRAALNFQKSSGHKLVTAQVIGSGPDGFSRTMEIDRGTADGIRPGMVVVTAAGLLGRVREVGTHMADVQTLADPQTRVDVYLPKSNLQGTASGGSGALELELQRTFGVVASAGDWALTSGVGGAYPRGLVVGEIAGVSRNDSAATDVAQLAWVNDPSAVSIVLVITDFVPA